MSLTPIVYTGTIPGGIPCVSSVTVEGKVNTDAERFNIELKSGLGDSNVSFHASFRFNEGSVVRNHKKDGTWGSEEREGAMPLSPGQHFIIQFTIHSNAIDMSVNGSHFSSFNHRLPMCSISYLAIYGGASVSSIKFS